VSIAGILARWVFILCLPVLLVSASIGWAANSLWLYRAGFEKYEVRKELAKAGLELTDTELEAIARGLISYFNSGEEYLKLTVMPDGQPVELFTQQEVVHFRDVKRLFRLDYYLFLGTLVYSLAYAGVSLLGQGGKQRRQLAWAMVSGSSLTLILMLALGLGTLFNFDQLFLQFHRLSFPNQFWSAPGYMLLLFPQGFWFDATILCAGLATTLAVLLGGMAGGYLLLSRS